MAAVSGTADRWHVELLDYPVLACSMGHERREACADFNTFWHERVVDALGLFQRRKLFRRRYLCRKCHTELAPPVVEDVDVEIRTGPDYEFRMRVTGPIARCVCGASTIRDQESDSFADALIDALERNGIARY